LSYCLLAGGVWVVRYFSLIVGGCYLGGNRPE
jgi:hypothetical protein